MNVILLTLKFIIILFWQQIVPDPCLFEPCDPNAECEREGLLSGNFTCSCQAPFTVGDGFNCSGMYRIAGKIIIGGDLNLAVCIKAPNLNLASMFVMAI